MRRRTIEFFVSMSFLAIVLGGIFLVRPDTDIQEFDGLAFKTIRNPDGSTQTLEGQLFLPTSAPPDLPAVVVVHGGSWKHTSGDMERLCRKLAHSGFAAFNINYRFAPQYLYPAPIEDVEAAVAWLRAHASKYSIDPKNIAGWGYSAGAHLILMAGLNPELGLTAIVAGGAPTDFSAWPDSPIITNFLGQSFESNQKLWREASPIYKVSSKSPPVFLYHGEQDDLVEIYQMERMIEALSAKNVPHETHRVSGLGHIGVYFWSQESVEKGMEFIHRNLTH